MPKSNSIKMSYAGRQIYGKPLAAALASELSCSQDRVVYGDHSAMYKGDIRCRGVSLSRLSRYCIAMNDMQLKDAARKLMQGHKWVGKMQPGLNRHRIRVGERSERGVSVEVSRMDGRLAYRGEVRGG